jgi:hypothetical protein
LLRIGIITSHNTHPKFKFQTSNPYPFFSKIHASCCDPLFMTCVALMELGASPSTVDVRGRMPHQVVVVVVVVVWWWWWWW